MNAALPGDIGLLAVSSAAGLLAGSFLNVVIYRGPHLWGLTEGEPRGGLSTPRSYCPACKATIPPWRLFPIISFALQRGRCATCGAPIPLRYPIVEALGAIVALASAAVFGATSAALGAALFGWALIALAFIDLETGYLPDAITIPLIAVGLGANLAGVFVPIGDALLGAVAGFVSFYAISTSYRKLRGKDGLGLGDAKLLGAIGAWGGWIILPAVVFAGALATLIAIAAASTFGKNAAVDQPIPFGPGLCAAGFVCVCASAAPIIFNAL